MKLKYILKKNLNIKNGYLIVIMITLLLVVGGYFSYAVFTTTNESKGALNIVTGNLYTYIDSPKLNYNKEITLAPREAKFIKIKLNNINTIDAKVNLYYSLSEASDKIEIGYITTGDTPPTKAGYVLEKSGSENDSKTIELRMVNDDSKSIKISFGSDAGLENVPLEFPTGKSVLEPLDGNVNLIRAYTYDQVKDSPTFCVTGEEETCQINQCYNGEDIDSCPVGTIIKYRVNDENDTDDIRYFHVMKDDGEHLTMQQREATIGNSNWLQNPSNNNFLSEGPLTVLELLNSATSNWKYVNDQTFKMGETIFKDNPYTGYKFDSSVTFQEDGYEFYEQTIDSNAYTMEEMTRKSRMITAQETIAFGCKKPKPEGLLDDVPPSCPVWMYNYLSGSIRNNGTIDAPFFAYWTMNLENTYSSYANSAVAVTTYGHLYSYNAKFEKYSARAVIDVNKR